MTQIIPIQARIGILRSLTQMTNKTLPGATAMQKLLLNQLPSDDETLKDLHHYSHYLVEIPLA